ncbi:MAG: response regulator [Oscillospiraceae bacterium]|nr:response regulator [Oscillospiraceae bacterium]MBQ5315286.1 response regulator [Oscillospiraceae bacterium]MBQ7958629.1 response regulator [Oscillospiraceae bacterium]MBR4093111.1 response regulator [Oscillospiraceae bacterium]MBR6695112.1 response regulator [Oscillospiraceae bacterium]
MEIKDIKVQISDDSVLVRKKMKDHLASLGITTVFEAVNGNEAVDVYKANKPDVVFMDIVMPEKSGVEALIDILAYDSSAKVVMASSVGTQDNLKIAIAAGAYEFLQKPVNFDDVTKIIEKIAERK